MSGGSAPERLWAVGLMRYLDLLGDVFTGGPVRRAARRWAGQPIWPVVAGAYVVGDPTAPVAICTLTDNDLIGPAARLPGVAIAGRVVTANLGLEKIILNLTANRRIRFLLVCGRDSALFRAGQTLRALATHGVTTERRVIGAEGYLPVLGNVPMALIEQFREQIELVDCTGEVDHAALGARVQELAARNPGPFAASALASTAAVAEQFVRIRPGGHRQPLVYDPSGYFVVTVDHSRGEIVVRHYRSDNTPAHEMRGRSGETMLLGLLREKLVSQLSHAGYLGAELAKAEAAVRLGLRYEQDQPLRREAG